MCTHVDGGAKLTQQGSGGAYSLVKVLFVVILISYPAIGADIGDALFVVPGVIEHMRMGLCSRFNRLYQPHLHAQHDYD